MQSKVGEIFEGKVTGLTAFGAFVKLANGESGMVHISEVAHVYVKDIKDHLTEGQEVKVKVIAINESNKISLSIKQAAPPKPQNENEVKKPRRVTQPPRDFSRRQNDRPTSQNGSGASAFEDMMAKFKQDSDEKISALKRSGVEQRSSRRGNGGK